MGNEMGDDGRLGPIAARCRWANSGSTVGSKVPELVSVAPMFEQWSVGDGRPQWVNPVTGLGHLASSIIEVVERARLGEVDPMVRAREDQARADNLVSGMIQVLTNLPTEGVVATVAGVCRLMHLILAGEATTLQQLDPAVARRGKALGGELDKLSDAARGAVLCRVSDSVSARVSAAIALSGCAGDGLVRRMVANRLLWAVDHERFDPTTDVPLAASVLGSPLDENVVRTLQSVVGCAVDVSRERLNGRKVRPADLMVEHLLKDTVGDPLLNVGVGEVLVRLLPELIEPRALKGKVADHRQASRYLEHTAVRPLTGAWDELIKALSSWDVMGSFVSGFVPVWRTEKGWALEREKLTDSEQWSLRIPRAEPDREHTVVAVWLGGLIGAAGGHAEARTAVQQRWAGLIPEAAVHTWMADHGLVVFQNSADAIGFSLRVNRTFLGADGLLVANDIQIALQPGARVSVGVAKGSILGGFYDGVVRIDGPAVARALELAAGQMPSRVRNDPLQIRRINVGDLGLESSGVACARDVVTDAWNRWPGSLHRYGDGRDVAGVAEDFESYPVEGWGTVSEGVALFVSLGTSRGCDVLEVGWFDPHAFRDLIARDRQLRSGFETDHGEGPDLEIEDDESAFDTDIRDTELDTLTEDPFASDQVFGGVSKEASIIEGWTDIGFGDDDKTGR
ncbi:MAG: hypothetical protein CL930_05405 [Deltaproteobacteria bacterium]|nr:hypothetical protein [Deltaproteobacteria bacterium]